MDVDPLEGVFKAFTVCPSCLGEDWKSAKLIILENTTNIGGDADGRITDPGAFSGGLREFLLSDRWFSWDSPIELQLELTATTSLVKEVKKFMLSHADLLAPPMLPAKPQKKEFFRDIEHPTTPKRRRLVTTRIEMPLPPDKPKPPQRRSFIEHIAGLGFAIFMAVASGVLAVAFGATELGAWLTCSFFFLLFVFAHIKHPKMVYEANLEEYEEARKHYESNYESAAQAVDDNRRQLAINSQYEKSYEAACQEYQHSLQTYKQAYEQRDHVYQQAVDRYRRDLAEYEKEKKRVQTIRELIWMRARVCTRCGECYLGEQVN